MEIKVGDIGNHRNILCKVTKIDGGKFTVSTPHGTDIAMGFAWLASSWKPLNDAEMAVYIGYVKDAEAIKKRFDLDKRLAEFR